MPDFEKRYRQLIENLLDAYALHEIICDEDGVPVDYRFLEVNSAFERMTGLNAEDLLGCTALEVMPNIEPHWIETYGRVSRTGEPEHFEEYSRELERHYEVVAFRPAPGRFACSFTDITERKQTQMALVAAKEEAERNYRYLNGILESIGDPVFVKDEQSRLLLVNNAFCEIFGLSRDEVIGKTLAEDVPPEERDSFLSVDRQVIADGRDSNVEESLTVRGEAPKTIMTRKSRFIDSDGSKFLVGVIRDISARKRAELDLAEEKERLAVTLRSIGDGVITTDTNGNIVMLNRSAEELTGWPSAEAAGRSLLDVFNIINERTRKPCRNPVELVLANQQTIELENNTCLIAKDGQEYVIADSAAPILDKEGQLLGVVLVFRDMTDKKNLENFIMKSQKLESLGVLAGGIAHDFNNLLSAIFGFAELALAETSNEVVKEYLEDSLKNIDRARDLTQQLLTFATGGVPMKTIGNLGSFVETTTNFVMRGSAVNCRFECPDGLWPCNFDQNQVGQVIENITINAQQAMPDGGTIAISLCNVSLGDDEHVSLAPGDYVKLSIEDQGCGIAPEHLPSIFDPYFSTKSDGHGLGLTTCYAIIRRHDGWIDVESNPGKGSAFHVYLPASVGAVPQATKKAAETHRGNGFFLVMDDEEAIRKLLSVFLESFGYTVHEARTGDEALEFCQSRAKADEPLAGMIFDLTVPGGRGGGEVMSEIRDVYPDVPAFVASGYSENPVIAYPDRHGFQASLRKPFTRQALAEVLNEFLGKR